MSTENKFRKGNIVVSVNTAILVTGQGDKTIGYPVFAGVVIMSNKTKEDERPWEIGMYSDTWSTEAFNKVNIKLSKLIWIAINPLSSNTTHP